MESEVRLSYIWTGGCSTTVVQQLEKPDRRDECWFVEQRTWQCPTTVADDGRQLQQVHRIQTSIGKLGCTPSTLCTVYT